MAIPTITHNSPSAGYIAWGAFTIRLNNVSYAVAAGSTNQRWVWWEYKAGVPVINAGAEVPATLVDDDLVLFANKGGIGFRVQSSSFVDGELIVDGTILADAIKANQISSSHIVTMGLDAGIIKFGTMHGDRILANTLASSKIAVSDFTNLVEDGTFDYGKIAWPTGSGIVVDDAPNYMQISSVSNSNSDNYQSSTIGVKDSETFHAYFEGFAEAGITTYNDLNLHFACKDAAGNFIEWPSITIPAASLQAAPQTWVPVQGVITLPPGTVTALIGIAVPANGVTGNKYRFRNLIVRRRSGGELIVDGTIDSTKVVAQGLDAKVIKFGEMSGDRITVNTLHGNKIVGKTIAAEQLSAEVILASTRIAAVGSAGQSVEMNPNGFFVFGPTSEGRPEYISFPTTSSAEKPNIISGTLQATTLSVEGNALTGQAATFRRNSQLEPGATFTLNNAVVPPVAAPSTSSFANETVISASVLGTFTGSTYHPGEDALYFVTKEKTTPNGIAVWTNRIYKLALATNVVTYVREAKYGVRNDIQAMGIAYFNNMFHVAYLDGLNILVGQFDPAQSWLQLSGVNFGGYGGNASGWNSFTIGTDGTNLWIADLGSTTANAMRFRKYLNTLSTTVQETVNTTFVPKSTSKARTGFTDLSIGAFDFGARKFMVTFQESWDINDTTLTTWDLAAFGTAGGARETGSEFSLMRTSGDTGLVWRAATPDTATGAFVGIVYDAPQLVRFNYSAMKTTGRSGIWSAANTFYRTSDGAQTTISPSRDFTMYSRYDWKSTVAAPPGGIGTRLYMAQAASGVGLKLQATLANGSMSVSASTYDAAGVAPPTQNSAALASATPSVIKSQETIAQTLTIGITSGSTTATGVFRDYMVGAPITGGTSIPAGTTVVSVVPGVSAVLSAAATATNATHPATLTLPKLEIRGNGYARITELERVIISSTTDVNASPGNLPPLRIGDITGWHQRLDGNEIQAMSDDSTAGGLAINASGGNVTLGHNTLSNMIALQAVNVRIGGKAFKDWNWGIETGTTNANGDITIPHGLGAAPDMVVVTMTGQEGVAGQFLTVWDRQPNNFKVRVRNNTGAVVASTARNIAWFAVRN